MKPNIYIETTIPSYLAAWPGRDLVTAAHQQITHHSALRTKIEDACKKKGYAPVIICTPEELLEVE